MMTFNDYCNLHQCDKGNIRPFGNCYADFYEKWFSQIREKATSICEIGILDGASLKCYYDYFLNTKILGLDINPDKTHHRNDRIHTDVLDQSNKQELIGFANKHIEEFDFLLDDGSHDVEHQQLTFGKLFKTIKSGGLYIIEDLGSSYFTLNTKLYGYEMTQTKINNNTIDFLNQRPFSSIWISKDDINYINQNVDYITIFDKCNEDLPYSSMFTCVNNYPIRSVTAIIKKK